MTLHEAIISVLSENQDAMRPTEIAQILNVNKLYTKKDGSPIKSSQIGARVKNYPHLFLKDNGYISLKSKTGIKKPAPTRRKRHSSLETVQQNPQLTVKVLMNEKNFKSVLNVKTQLPEQSGLYCIRVKDINVFEGAFKSTLIERKHNIVYVGIASKSLHKRLSQELWAKGHGTFFRSIGAVLGYTPVKGSLAKRKNKNNYKFSTSDEAQIIQWIERHLKVNWIVTTEHLKQIEQVLINHYLPLLNIAGNPVALDELQRLREECKRVARGE